MSVQLKKFLPTWLVTSKIPLIILCVIGATLAIIGAGILLFLGSAIAGGGMATLAGVIAFGIFIVGSMLMVITLIALVFKRTRKAVLIILAFVTISTLVIIVVKNFQYKSDQNEIANQKLQESQNEIEIKNRNKALADSIYNNHGVMGLLDQFERDQEPSISMIQYSVMIGEAVKANPNLIPQVKTRLVGMKQFLNSDLLFQFLQVLTPVQAEQFTDEILSDTAYSPSCRYVAYNKYFETPSIKKFQRILSNSQVNFENFHEREIINRSMTDYFMDYIGRESLQKPILPIIEKYWQMEKLNLDFQKGEGFSGMCRYEMRRFVLNRVDAENWGTLDFHQDINYDQKVTIGEGTGIYLEFKPFSITFNSERNASILFTLWRNTEVLNIPDEVTLLDNPNYFKAVNISKIIPGYLPYNRNTFVLKSGKKYTFNGIQISPTQKVTFAEWTQQFNENNFKLLFLLPSEYTGQKHPIELERMKTPIEMHSF